MDAFVAMPNYIMTTSTMTAELSEIRAKLTLLERADEDNAEAVNDLSEDMRKELDNIYEGHRSPCRSKFQRPANSPGPSVLSNQSKRAMTQKQAIQLFEERKVRTVWDDKRASGTFRLSMLSQF